MLNVIAEDFIQPDHLDTVRPWYAELVEKTRQEPLCIAYDLFIDQNDPGHFVFIEQWPDQAALDAHCASEHFRRLVPQINAYQAKPCRVVLMEGFTGAAVPS
ncbi:Quinol monooxygenase YgiN [Pseudomonas sp. ok272]|uniref:putative quinol monooxygenase n=1 Tax=unclassified Pseudomonas TaxID=196821 RepID=UPI0008CB8183|nr:MULTISPECIES: putative quinol monooxygenase [unclassified Pseudomonas]SEN14544.1 Quinol monooxygenase YgiN [Pseudomonas sp. ok272]SFN07003.1 Quinol monooxygenase YgiN [Pseudomonas sp. ok602]